MVSVSLFAGPRHLMFEKKKEGGIKSPERKANKGSKKTDTGHSVLTQSSIWARGDLQCSLGLLRSTFSGKSTGSSSSGTDIALIYQGVKSQKVKSQRQLNKEFNFLAIITMNDRNWGPPISLTRNQPIPQTNLFDFDSFKTFLFFQFLSSSSFSSSSSSFFIFDSNCKTKGKQREGQNNLCLLLSEPLLLC